MIPDLRCVRSFVCDGELFFFAVLSSRSVSFAQSLTSFANDTVLCVAFCHQSDYAMTDEEKRLILLRHNQLRADAVGRNGAGNIQMMTWDDALVSCRFAHYRRRCVSCGCGCELA